LAIKFKEVQCRTQGVTYLACTTDKKVTFDYRQAQRLARNDQKYLLPFSFTEKGPRADLFYFIDNTRPLADFLAQGLFDRHIALLFKQAVRMLDTCFEEGLLLGNVCFDTQRVYVGSKDSRLKFIYLPVTGLQSEDRSLLGFLTYIASTAQPKDDAAARYARGVLDYLRRQEVFSFVKFKSFLESDGTADPPLIKSNTMREPDALDTEKLYRDFVLEQEKGRG
jgi:hypothetical protein